MKEFVTAAASELEDDGELIEFKHDGREVAFISPTPAQASMMMLMISGDARLETAGTFIHLWFEMMADDETKRYFRSRLLDRNDTFELDGEGGVVEIFEHLVEEMTGNPTKQPSDYQQPQSKTGKRSTAGSSRRTSTRSSSRSRATSRLSTTGSDKA